MHYLKTLHQGLPGGAVAALWHSQRHSLDSILSQGTAPTKTEPKQNKKQNSVSGTVIGTGNTATNESKSCHPRAYILMTTKKQM